MNVLAFTASPRAGGNSDTLLDGIVAGLHRGGVSVEKINTRELSIEPCSGCGVCKENGRCAIDDDFQAIYDRLIDCDGVVFASPLYFMNVPGKAKLLIDRCQVFWSAREIRGIDLFNGRKRFGLLAVCAAKRRGPGGVSIFRGIQDTMHYVFQSLGLEELKPLLVPGVEEKGAVTSRTGLLESARNAGRDMARRITECTVRPVC